MTASVELFIIGVAAPLWLAFMIGTIPFGYVLTRAAGLGDIRRIGSGGTGATNVLRTGRRDIATATLVLDAGKGAFAVWAVGHLPWPGMAAAAGVAVVLGHCYSIWLGGKGGKGVATGLGVIAMLGWPVAMFAGACWLLVAWRSRRSSVGALSVCAVAPLAMLAWDGWQPALALAVIAVVVVWRHRGNIARLRAGTEPRIGAA